MRNLWLITKEDFKNLVVNPMWVFYATAFPILLILIMGFLTKDNYGSKMSSFDYYAITLGIYTAINSGMTAANAFMEEKIKKPNMRIIYAPGSAKNIFLSKILASFAFCTIFHMLDLSLVIFIFGVKMNHVLELVILFVLLELCSNTLGVMLCCIFKKETITNQILSIVLNLLAIFGGLLFSLDGYGSTVRKISLASPVKWLANASFQMIYDNSSSLFLPCVIVMLGTMAVMLVICNITFRKEDCVC